ncbi:hypothetical protein DN412_39740 [Cupriavidus lacunae]|uniref:Exonuclease domain-containing protein n=1 Tax=Cupriavidus lacunae TaxID=2666307 RepID=A0A370NHB8_9BURK|nr:hypothetical protein DN412_39740 [Cupriavidus lacunae]
MQTVAFLDFETTGLSPSRGDRATEIAVILLRDGENVERFQSLMNAGRRIPSQVVSLTGITNDMISDAPAPKVLASPTWAGNQHFACTMLTFRRIYPHAQNHRLGWTSKLRAFGSSTRALATFCRRRGKSAG